MKPRDLDMEGRIKPDGIWAWIDKRASWSSDQALFVDRDGVVLEYVPYLARSDAARLLPGVPETIAAANRLGIPVAVVTNQSGIGRGYYSWSDFTAVLTQMQFLLLERGAHVDAVFACPYHEDAQPPYDRPDHPGRKPNAGMLLRAALEMQLSLATSWIVGDTADDLLAGRAAGLAGGVHVLTGLGAGRRGDIAGIQTSTFRVEVADHLGEAAPRLLDRLSNKRIEDTAIERRVA